MGFGFGRLVIQREANFATHGLAKATIKSSHVYCLDRRNSFVYMWHCNFRVTCFIFLEQFALVNSLNFVKWKFDLYFFY
jgi:hypothetical protein